MKRAGRLLVLASFFVCAACFYAVPAFAATVTQELPGDVLPDSAFPGDGGCAPIMTAYGKLFGVACGIGDVSFTLHSPEGWRADRATGKRAGAGVAYVLGGASAADARAVLYAQVRKAEPGNQEEAAQAAAQKRLRGMCEKRPEAAPALREAAPYAAKDGMIFALRFFDNVPASNKSEAAAYLLHNGVVFTVLLSVRSDAERDALLPEFKKALQGVMINGVVSGQGKEPGAEKQ